MMPNFAKLDALLDAHWESTTSDMERERATAIRDYFRELFHTRVFLPLTLDHRCFRCGAPAHSGQCTVGEDPYIEWVEPLDITTSDPVYSRARRSHIARMRRRLEPRYESDEDAVEDFMAIMWAWYVTYPTRGGGPESSQNSEAS